MSTAGFLAGTLVVLACGSVRKQLKVFLITSVLIFLPLSCVIYGVG